MTTDSYVNRSHPFHSPNVTIDSAHLSRLDDWISFLTCNRNIALKTLELCETHQEFLEFQMLLSDNSYDDVVEFLKFELLWLSELNSTKTEDEDNFDVRTSQSGQYSLRGLEP